MFQIICFTKQAFCLGEEGRDLFILLSFSPSLLFFYRLINIYIDLSFFPFLSDCFILEPATKKNNQTHRARA